MAKSQLELLVLLQDIDLMLQEPENEERNMGFPMEGRAQLEKAREEITRKIDPRSLGAYNRLNSRYKYPIVPVQKDTCLGCFAKLPTSYTARARDDRSIFTCEQCGRILYWIE